MTDTPQPPQGTQPGAGVPWPARPDAAVQKPRRRRSVWAILATIFLVLSVVGNLVLMVAVIGLVAVMGGTGGIEEGLLERTVEKGPHDSKIVVIHIDGFIDEYMVESVRAQVDRAARDSAVRAVILRIDSPGGGLTASDMIHHEVRERLTKCGKPVVAAMDGVAASGGYYIACSADKIVAQTTTVTGSIGIIAQFFYLQGLLKDRLGVVPVTLTIGEKKGWPNMFDLGMTEEQRTYFMETLLRPGYDRFVNVVSESRRMKRDDVLKLATGRIYMGPEARQTGLVDEVGYFERAVEIARDRAGVSEARVVEYVRPFSLSTLLGLTAKTPSVLDLRPERLAEMASPRVMYLWTGF
jgi:protease-4